VRRLIFVALMLLISCTGSFEDSGTPVRLIFSVNPSSSKDIACIGQTLAVPKSPGLVLLDPNRFASSVNQTDSCGAFVSLLGAPFNTVNGAEITGAPSVFVSIPSQSVVKQFTYLQSANNTVQIPNTLTQKIELKYLQKDQNDDPGFCPTQLAISRDNQRLAVLDNPNDTQAACVSTDIRLPRIIVFNIANASILARIDISKVSNFIDGKSKAISIALLNNNRLYVLGEFAGQYKITSFDLNATDPNTTNIFLFDPSKLPPSYSSFPTFNPKVDLSFVQNGLLASLSNDVSGQVFPIIEDTTLKTITFGEERKAGSLATDPPIGKTTTVRSNASSASITSNFTLFLRPDNILFQRSTQFAVQNIISPIDATFPADNTIWVLNTKRLFKLDARDFPEKPQFDTGIDLTDLSPGNLVWTFDEN
jgi:hypothetical protein